MSDPYASIARPVEDPYARISTRVDKPARPAPKLDQRQQAEADDIAHSDGILDRVGDLWSRGAAAVDAGALSLGGVLQDLAKVPLPWNTDENNAANAAAAEASQARFRDQSRQRRAVAATAIPNETSWEDVKAKPSMGNIGAFVGEGGVQSLPGMITAMAALPAYIASQTGNIGQQRAENDGRETITGGDAAAALPAAVGSALIEQFAGSRLLGPVAGNVVTKGLNKMGGEALTEAAQTGIEYSGSNLGTEKGFDPVEAADQMAGAAVVGAGVGVTAHGAVETGKKGVQAVSSRIKPSAYDAFSAPVEPTMGVSYNPEPEGVPVPAAQPEPEPVPVAQPAPPEPVPVAQPAPPEPAPAPVAQSAPAEPVAPVATPEPVAQPAPEPAPTQPDNLRPEPGDLAEGERLVRTPAGGSIRTRMEVVDASTLQQAEGANQNRDRSRETTDLQVQNIISKFDPEQLHEDPSSDRGAPIVGIDNAVDSGNGRMLTLNKIYDQYPELAQKYRSMIESRGYSTEGMERPVLIQRRMTDFTPGQRRQFVIDSNKDTKLELSPVERARGDADSITPEMLATYAGGDLNSTANSGFVQAFTKRLTAGEMGNMIGSDRRLTTTGAQRIENAVVAAAYEKPKLLERMMESAQDDIRAITGSLADVAAPWARMRQSVKAGEVGSQYDITDQLADAAARISDARKAGTKPADILAQQDAFDPIDPIAQELIRGFYNTGMTRAASRKAVSDFLASYVKTANEQTETEGLFGKEPGKAPADILRDLLEARDNPNGAGLALFDKETTNEQQRTAVRDTGRDLERADDGKRDGGDGPHDPARARSRTEGRNHVFSHAGEGGGRRARPAPENRPRQGEKGASGARDADRSENEAEGARAASDKNADRLALDEDESGPDYAQDRPSLVADRGPYDPDFATASFTNRASIYQAAAESLGMDPDAFHLLPAPRQIVLLQRAMAQRFGVLVKVDPAMQERFAIDQMLDAYQNVQGMAHVLDLPSKAVSLGGKLHIQLQKKGNFLGAFAPGGNLIMLPKRSNSFAHEWGHALDWHLLALTESEGKGLTGAIRKDGDEVQGQIPTTVRAAFVDLLNAMFFDKAGAAQKIMALEAKIEKTTSAKAKADAQAQIDRLVQGNSQARDIRSAFYKGAKSFDGPGGDYWTSPTEMFARAFEAFVSYKVEAAGLTTEFIGKGDAGYLSNAEERFAKTFPKGEERARIFAAFEQVFGQMADQETLGSGPAAEKPVSGVRRITDYDKTPPKVKNEAGIIGREIEAIKRASRQAKKEAAGRGDDPKGMMEKLADLNGVTFMSMAANLRMIQARSGSRSLQKLIDLLTKQDGRGDRTVTRTFAEDVHLQSKSAVNKITNILKRNGIQIEGRLADEDMALRDLLTGAISPDGTPGPNAPEDYRKGEPPMQIPPQYVKAAAQIRHVLDNEFYVNQKAGIDLGYTRNGYLTRSLDMPKVYHDQPGFTRQAAKVYEIVFDNEFGGDPVALLSNEELFPKFMKIAAILAKGGSDLPSLDDVRARLKEINKLYKQAAAAKKDGDGDRADTLEAKAAQKFEELGDVFGDLYDEVKPEFARERAEAWLAKINLVAGEEHNAGAPASQYIKKRSLPPEADKLMEKFYVSDPIETVRDYLVASARRTSYTRRFGADGKKRRELFEGMAAEGVSPDDQRTVERILDTATGRVRSTIPRSFQNGLSFVHAAGTMALLPRATLSSLAEPFTAGLVTGDARSGFKLMGMMIGSALGAPSGKVRNELARAMGIVSDVGSDDIMTSRYGQTYADETRWDRYTAAMFTATGLTALTRAQKAHGVGLGHAFLDNLAGKILGGKGADVEHAVALMRELGVRDPEAFSRELADGGRLPTVEELDSEFGKDYATAQLRFSNMIIQDPDGMDRPELAQNPVGRVVYGITGFSYAYWRNIIKRNGILLGETWKRDKGKAVLYASALFASAATAYLLAATISTVREKLLNPSRWEELEREEKLESTMAQLAFTRTFAFGAADVAIQTWTGLKYQRDLSNAFVGAGPGFFLQNAQKVGKIAVENSRKTNTAEFNALQGTYSLASPFISFGLARIPGGPVITAAKGVGLGYATSGSARDQFASAVVGEKNTRKVRTPTAYDELLDKYAPKE